MEDPERGFGVITKDSLNLKSQVILRTRIGDNKINERLEHTVSINISKDIKSILRKVKFIRWRLKNHH